MRNLHSECVWWGLGALLALSCASAHAFDVTVSDGASVNGAWAGNVWTPTAAGAVVSATEVAQHLAGGSVTIRATGTDALTVTAPVSWNANTLILNAGGNISIRQVLTGTDTAALELQYGQSAPAAGNTADYGIRAPVNLADTGQFITLLGNDGSATLYKVITKVGNAADATAAPTPMTLQGMNTALDGHYVLGADIDASDTVNWNGGEGFAPIGASNATPFTGTLGGLGHTIDKLTINHPNSNYQGLFGDVSGYAMVRDVGLTNVSVIGYTIVGGFVGYLETNSWLRDSFANGKVISTASIPASVMDGHVIGSLVGYLSGGINNCFSTVNLDYPAPWDFRGYHTTSGTLAGAGGGVIGTVEYSYFAGTTHVDGGGDVPSDAAHIAMDHVAPAWSYYVHSAYQEAFDGGDTVTFHESVWDWHMNALSTYGGWDISASGGTGATWRIYDGQAYPLLSAFLTPLTVTANSGSRPYDGTTAGLGVHYSSPPDASKLSGSATTTLDSPDVGVHTVTPAGLYSNAATGYDLLYASGTVTVTPASQTITGLAANPANGTAGSASMLSASGGASGNPVVFSSLTPGTCAVYGNAVSYLTAGTCTVRANQASSANYAAATPADLDIPVGLGSQAITDFVANSAGGTATLSAIGGGSGNRVMFASATPDICLVSGDTVIYLAAGTCTLAANQAGNAGFSAAPQASISVQAVPVPPVPVLTGWCAALLSVLLALLAAGLGWRRPARHGRCE